MKSYQITNSEKKQFLDSLSCAKKIAIAGHTNPDGDCVGSCLGLYNYIKSQSPDTQIEVLLEPIPEKFKFLKGCHAITQEESMEYDLFIAVDCSDLGRLTKYAHLVEDTPATICIDHHITNQGYGDLRYIYPHASSTCEVIVQLLDYDLIDTECAQALYMGIVHDTGVFKHSNTSRKTMEIAGSLLDKDVHPEFIIDDTFYKKSYKQNQILGRALLESIQMLDGRMIFSILSKKDLTDFEVASSDLDGIIDQLRVTEGTEVATFLYPKDDNTYKVSMRSNHDVNVSAIAMEMGGGGHVKAAGCSSFGQPRDIVMNIARLVEAQLEEQKEK